MALFLLLAAPVAAAPGDENWSTEFGSPGTDGPVYALLSVGGDLYVGGGFSMVDGVAASRIVRWDGAAWQPLAGGLNGTVRALTQWQGQIYVAGDFTGSPGGPALSRVARWDGAAWHPLNEGTSGSIYVLAEWNGRLIAAGSFLSAGAAPAARIAAWDGISWTALGEGLNNSVLALATYEGRLMAGGQFNGSGALSTGTVAAWNGNNWIGFGSPGGSAVYGLGVHMGRLMACGGCAAWDYWDGASWVGGMCSTFPTMTTMTVRGDTLLAGGYSLGWGEFGDFYFEIGYQVGDGAFQSMPSLSGPINAATTYRDEIVVGGSFEGSQDLPGMGILAWSSGGWHPLIAGTGNQGISKPPHMIGALGSMVLIGGDLSRCGRTRVFGFASWDGHQWASAAPPDGLSFDRYDGGRLVSSSQVYDGELVVAGSFDLYLATETAHGIGRWNGSSWRSLRGGIGTSFGDVNVTGLGLFRGDLIAAGQFGQIGGVTANGIAGWNGSTWSPLGPGITVYGDIQALVEYRGELFIAGSFGNAGGLPLANFVRYDGTSWRSGGAGAGAFGIRALSVWNDRLYAGGNFTSFAGQTAMGLAVYDGTSWQPVGSGVRRSGGGAGEVRDLEVHDGRLYVSGWFDTVDGVPAHGIATFDGSSWHPLGSGISYPEYMAFTGQDLFLSGSFLKAGGRSSIDFARWSEPPVAVRLASFSVARDVSGAVVRWSVADAEDHAGFRLYRASPDTPESDRQEVSGLLSGQTDYEYADTRAPLGAVDYWLLEIARTGTTVWHGPAQLAAAPPLPGEGRLLASPNPFRGSVRLAIEGRVGQGVELGIFDVRGIEVRRLLLAPAAGSEPATIWDGNDRFGQPLPPGSYFVRPSGADASGVVKVVKLQ